MGERRGKGKKSKNKKKEVKGWEPGSGKTKLKRVKTSDSPRPEGPIIAQRPTAGDDANTRAGAPPGKKAGARVPRDRWMGENPHTEKKREGY